MNFAGLNSQAVREGAERAIEYLRSIGAEEHAEYAEEYIRRLQNSVSLLRAPK